MKLPILLNDKAVVAVKKHEVEIARAKAIVAVSHEILWDVIYAEYPALDENQDLTIDIEYNDIGIVVLKKAEN